MTKEMMKKGKVSREANKNLNGKWGVPSTSFKQKRRVQLKNNKFRVLWIVGNVFLYVLLIGYATWVVLNIHDLQKYNMLTQPIVFIIALFFVALYGSYRIRTWIQEGKI